MLNDLLFRLRALFRADTVDGELAQELRFHLESQVLKYLDLGLSRDQAERRARMEFGGLAQVKEECRDARGINLVETLFRDLRYGLRTLRQSPGFTTVAAITAGAGHRRHHRDLFRRLRFLAAPPAVPRSGGPPGPQ